MKVLINHSGKTNAEIIGANIEAVQFRTTDILNKIESREIKTNSEVFVEILKKDGLNDAEKLILFHTVNKIMESSVIIIIPPKGPTQ